jgi:transketolase
VLLVATGSEVHVALAARDLLEAQGTPTRVVSMPCLEWFTAQDEAYRRTVLPAGVRARVTVEAGVAQSWWKVLGEHGVPVSLEHFGASAPGAVLFEQFGFTAEGVVAAAHASLAAAGDTTGQ